MYYRLLDEELPKTSYAAAHRPRLARHRHHHDSLRHHYRDYNSNYNTR